MPDVRLRITGKNVSKKALSDLRSDIAKTNKSLKESKDQVEDLREETEKFKEGLTGIGVAAGVAFTALSAVVIKATRDYARFSHSVATVSTMIREDVARNTSLLSQGVREIARTVPQSVSILNAALYDLLSASVPVNESLTMLRQSGKAAVAGVSDVNTAANLATGTINALGMAFTEADKVFDVAFSTVRAGKVTFSELAASMGQVLPAAAKMGSTIDEVYGSIAFLTKNAMDAAMASVSFARALDGLGDKAAKLKDIGIRVFGEKGEYLGILNIMGQIAKQMEGLTEEARVNLMKEMGFDIRAARAITVMSTNLDAFRKTMDEVSDSAGATEEAFDKMKDTLTNSWVILKNNLRDLSIVMGETFGAPALAMINTLVDALQRLSDTQKRMVAWGTAVGVAIFGVTTAAVAFVLLKPKLLLMAAAFVKVAKAVATIAVVLAPFAAGVAAAGLAVAGMAWALNEYKKARKDVFTEAALAATASNIKGVEKAVEEWGEKVKGLSKFLDEAKQRGADLAEEYSEQTDRLKYYERMMAAAVIELRALKGDTFGAAVATRDLRAALKGAGEETGYFKGFIEALFSPLDFAGKQILTSKEALDALRKSLSEAKVEPEFLIPTEELGASVEQWESAIASIKAAMEQAIQIPEYEPFVAGEVITKGYWEAARETKKAIAAIDGEHQRLTSSVKELLDNQWAAEEKRLKDLEVGEEALQKARFNHYKEYEDKVTALRDKKWKAEQKLLQERDAYYQAMRDKDLANQEDMAEEGHVAEEKEFEQSKEALRDWLAANARGRKKDLEDQKRWATGIWDLIDEINEFYRTTSDQAIKDTERIRKAIGATVAAIPFDMVRAFKRTYDLTRQSEEKLANLRKETARRIADIIYRSESMSAARKASAIEKIERDSARKRQQIEEDLQEAKKRAFSDYLVSYIKGITRQIELIEQRKLAEGITAAIGGEEKVVDWGALLGSFLKGVGIAIVSKIILSALGLKEGGILPGKIVESYRMAQPAKMVSAAGGGIFKDPTLALIGEGHGAEAVVPLTGNRKIPVELRGSAGDINIDKIEIILPEGYLENMDQATFNRIFMKRMLPAIHNAKRAGLINEAFV